MYSEGRASSHPGDFSEFRPCYLESDEKLVHMHGRMAYAVNRKRDIYDKRSGKESESEVSGEPTREMRKVMARVTQKRTALS